MDEFLLFLRNIETNELPSIIILLATFGKLNTPIQQNVSSINDVRVPVHGQSLIKHFFVDDIHTDKNVIIAANENGTEWKPTPKNETEDSGVTEEGNKG